MRNPPQRDTQRVFDYIRDCVEHPENHPEHWEDWLRAGRRRFLLLNIIYYIQHVQGKEEVSKEDLKMFLGELYYVDREMFSNIIKPWKSLDDTLKELLEQKLIVQVSEGAYLVNEQRIQDEEDLIYWEGIRKTLDEVGRKLREL
ncbi:MULTISPECIES: hypothetical protein [Thermococcus]|uniref:Uncharacterized protein n=2 Tax=Thermococcus sibiricus TaxID=172049 RepID=C6A0R2_THESM|nr:MULTISPECIES: hypothetical protein [Thermococcus]KUK28992.1 MAG: Uncharacterized protein XD61_0446 [Thermococcus sp. 40_45]HII67285.1 hypothetical protein [Thermococcaceae archaeon]ACS89207.1 hypothetical protein TSIB_0139 [Thermococcus sibiricus MM 739]KUK17486.1 MAG: Uncharacterized protein XD54_1245 [Thermococcus sibiricus]MBC7095699.1 hypothetical protein [Thermococcus sp.]